MSGKRRRGVGGGGRGVAAEEPSAGKRRDRFIKVMADYFNIPMAVCAPFVVSCQFNNPRPGDSFLAGASLLRDRMLLALFPRSTRRRRIGFVDLTGLGREMRDRQGLAVSRISLRESADSQRERSAKRAMWTNVI